MDAAHALDTPDHAPTDRNPHVFALAAALAFGVSAWLYGVHIVLVGESNTLAGHLAHATRDGLLAFPLAVLAVGFGRWLAHRWGIGEDSARDRLAVAAGITLVFAVGLVPGAGTHLWLDRFLDNDAPGHLFHGHGIPVGVEGATDLLSVAVHGVRDALIGLAAAFPVAVFGLALGAWRRRVRFSGQLATSGWTLPGRLLVSTAAVLVLVGSEITLLTFAGGGEADDDHHAVVHHAPIVTAIPTAAAAEVDGVRVVTRSAQWVRYQPAPASGRTPASVDPDRLYLVFTIENPGSQTRTFARKEVHLIAPSGTVWTPLADDFPAIHLGPRDSLTTMLVFEVPAPEPGLQLAWVRGSGETRIPLGELFIDPLAQKPVSISQ
jgi:hypothetical protein